MMLKTGVVSALLLLGACLGLLGAAAEEIIVGKNITEDARWTADNTYLLTEQIYVKEPAELYIEPGVTVKAETFDSRGYTTALIINSGATIRAMGTRDAPITFSANQPPEAMQNARGLWGGIIVLGRAPTNKGASDAIEGLSNATFGGTDPDDSSGEIHYTRIWHGGAELWRANEINGLTFGGVGRATKVDHVEVAFNYDDGIEFFGGTVDLKYVSLLCNGDDSLDADEGYQGRVQYLLVVLCKDIAVGDDSLTDHAFEMDNNGKDYTASPRSHPIISHATLLGPGSSKDGCDRKVKHSKMAHFREGLGGTFANMIVAHSPAGFMFEHFQDAGAANFTQGLSVSGSGNEAFPDFLYLSPSNVLFNVDDAVHSESDIEPPTIQYISQDPQLANVDPCVDGREDADLFDPRPAAGSPAFSDLDDTLSDDPFFDKVGFKGAFNSSDLWIAGWTWWADQGKLPQTQQETAADDAAEGGVTDGEGTSAATPHTRPASLMAFMLTSVALVIGMKAVI
ncbi:unnamed protein product [Vitrella brassicaformis CCMP3155]|uniref:Right handed beta helix domain-containing protein n=2 Tax=Vitrella brassicaformis TaxID=1169539 RepID=A0A0G4EJU8_VITBC|nr:unnamed protein product [Vitrella brassicaformis CCMP3155]|eukprot:CEL96668.1 unnamed protein product [Vitrella brassicaformis CCMP3155]